MVPDGPKSELPTAPITHDGTLRTVTRGAEPELGTYLGQFRVEARLGQGGLGIVYRAYDEKLAREVALKVLAEASSLAAGAHLLEEARAAASLTHPCIAAIHDVQQQNNVVFIVMELVPGSTLRAEVKKGPIDPATAVRYARDIASGLARAHRSGIVHRDLKPENVMVTPEGTAKILDFGLAREAPDTPPASEAGATGIAGTPSYMAPEQARGERVDARADVFSFGVVLYEMLAGKRPFVRPKTGLPPAPEEWRIAAPLGTAAPDAPAELARIVERCLTLERGKRFANGAEVLDALRALDALPPPPSPRSARSARITRLVAAAGAGLLLVAGGVAAFRVARGGAATPPRDLPVSAVAPPPPVDDPATKALRAELDQARSAWRAGDAHARAMLEKVVHDVEHTGARASTPTAQIAAEAVLLLGDLDEKALVAPAPRKPTTMQDLGPTAMFAVQDTWIHTAKRYNEVPVWGAAPPLLTCAEYRAGRVWEKLNAIARAAKARDLAAMKQPAVEALYPGGHARLEADWETTLNWLRTSAATSYDAAVSVARYVDGPIRDPGDGSDCRGLAVDRREAMEAEAGP